MSFRTQLIISMAKENINKQRNQWPPTTSKNLRSTCKEKQVVNTIEPNLSHQYGKEEPGQDSNKGEQFIYLFCLVNYKIFFFYMCTLTTFRLK